MFVFYFYILWIFAILIFNCYQNNNIMPNVFHEMGIHFTILIALLITILIAAVQSVKVCNFSNLIFNLINILYSYVYL